MKGGTCQRCAGCGQIANTDDAEPWKYWAELPVQSAAAVIMGIVKPLPCPDCFNIPLLTRDAKAREAVRLLIDSGLTAAQFEQAAATRKAKVEAR